jgi:chromate transport protein ChrA
MTKLPVYFGYAGVIPFIFFMLFTLVADFDDYKSLTIVQIAYASMIASFLAGVHWGQAIPAQNNRQMSFAMIPTIASLFLLIWAILADPVLPLAGMAGLFWMIYAADKKYMPLDFIPDGYFAYRRNLTIIVSSTLLISAWAAL